MQHGGWSLVATPTDDAIRGIELRQLEDGSVVLDGELPLRATFAWELLAIRAPFLRVRGPKRRLIDLKLPNARAVYRMIEYHGTYVVGELCYSELPEEGVDRESVPTAV